MIKIGNEVGVRECFSRFSQELGYKVIKSQEKFPDLILETETGRKVRTEVEKCSKDFDRHLKNEFFFFASEELKKFLQWDALQATKHFAEGFYTKFGGDPEDPQFQKELTKILHELREDDC